MTRPSARVALGAAVGILVLAALGLGAWLWAGARDRRAVAAYAEPLARLAAPRSQALGPEARAAIARDLEAALAQHPSASIAAQAAFELGNLRHAARDFAGARSAWEVAAAQAASPTLRTLARAGVGDAWEAEGNPGKAAQAYQAALAPLRPADFHYEALLLALGRVQEQSGQQAAAVETYRRLLREQPHSPRADDVRGRLAAMGVTP